MSTRPGWEDVVPIPQDDGPNPVVAIAYPPDFVEAMDLFRAVLIANELSERALALTTEVIDLNPANYTAWTFRRRCLYELNCDLRKELEYVQQMAGPNPKNYQIWYHRRAIVEKMGNADLEDQFVRGVLEVDAKNYHAWAHRQWCMATFNLFDGELEFITELLDKDVRNNSAWNQRWFTVHQSGTPVTDEIIVRELEYALSYVECAIDNESPWNYIRGYFRKRSFKDFPFVKAKCLEWKESIGGASPQLHSFLLEVYRKEGSEDAKNKALEICSKLETELDQTRAKYWSKLKTRIEAGIAIDSVNQEASGIRLAQKLAVEKA